MVRQVKILVVMLVLITALCGTVQASTHTVYDNGTLSTTYITYFKDILSGAKFNDNYIAFRSEQNEYTMVVGKLEYTNNTIKSTDECKHYRFYQVTTSGYNSTYYYDVTSIDEFSLDTGNYILYSDVGDYPQLIERGAKYEMLSAVLLIIIMLSVVIRRIFFKR